MSDTVKYRLWLMDRVDLTREELIEKATEMGIWDDPHTKTDDELAESIRNEQAIIDFDTRLQRQTPERQAEIIHELRLKLEQK